MTLKQIATLLNDTIVPNVLGENAEPIAEDLSNIVDLGTSIEKIDADTVKDYAKKFVAGVAKTYFDTREYRKVTPDIFIDAQEYGGVIQRVKSRLLKARDAVTMSLKNGQSYDNHVYNGIETSNKIYEKDTIFEVWYSIPDNMFKKSFTSADGVMGLVALIETTVEKTINNELHALSMRVLNALALSANGTRVVNLRSMYNNLTGGDLDVNDCLTNYEFLQWSAGVIERLRAYVQDMNLKYNDGEAETFTKEEDLRVTMLKEFDTALTNKMLSSTFHDNLIKIGKYNTVNAWQTTGTELLPSISTTGKIVASLSPITEGNSADTLENVVGLIYDRYSCGITLTPIPVRADYNGRGGFTTYYNDQMARYFIDSRETAIVLTLN